MKDLTDPFARDLVALLPRLRRFALSLSRRADLADDLVQVTAERAYAARDRFDPATRMDSWCFRILRNAWLDGLRRDQSRGPQVDIADAPDAGEVDGVAVTESRLMLQAVMAAMDRLPQDQREVLMLVCVEELSYKEAAAILDIPLGTVMSRLSRGRLALASATGIN
ncbi:MAG: RNA polymerase sigma factor [Gemmobacter sp.]|nr:RNA polymerase sigma factor [Gemmobacter sp.]